MAAGMDLFDEYRHLAPQATLRYRLLPRQPGTNMEGIVVSVVANTFTLPVPLGADNSFALERNAAAWAEDAAVITNRKSDSMTWRVQVRSPGLAEHTRRLGDLRLECMVGRNSGLTSNYSSLPYKEWIKTLSRRDVQTCLFEHTYLLFAERPLFSVTLRDGKRTDVIPLKDMYYNGQQMAPAVRAQCDCHVLIEKTYLAPLTDLSWGDDTILEFDYMDGASPLEVSAPALPIVIGKSGMADVIAVTGKAPHTLSFDNGYVLWAYQYRIPASAPNKQASAVEFVILFDPAGIVKNMRTRDMNKSK